MFQPPWDCTGGHCPGNQGDQWKIREGEKQLKESGNLRGGERKVSEKSENFDKSSERENFTAPQVQLDDLSFCQNAKKKS